MDPTSVLKNEIFRPLTSLVVPGSVALAPFILLCQNYSQGIQGFATKNQGAYAVVLFIAVLFAGLVLEDIGGHLEVRIADQLEASDKLNAVSPTHKEIWHSYVKLNTQDQIIGQRYLRTIVTRFYFELSATPALVIFLLGFHWLNFRLPFISSGGSIVVSVIVFALIYFLYTEAKRSASVLSTLREAIIDGYNEFNAKEPKPDGPSFVD